VVDLKYVGNTSFTSISVSIAIHHFRVLTGLLLVINLGKMCHKMKLVTYCLFSQRCLGKIDKEGEHLKYKVFRKSLFNFDEVF
jgi:hypothetical protein